MLMRTALWRKRGCESGKNTLGIFCGFPLLATKLATHLADETAKRI